MGRWSNVVATLLLLVSLMTGKTTACPPGCGCGCQTSGEGECCRRIAAREQAAEAARQRAAEYARQQAEHARQQAAEHARQQAELARQRAAEHARQQAELARQRAAEHARQQAERARQRAAEHARQQAERHAAEQHAAEQRAAEQPRPRAAAADAPAHRATPTRHIEHVGGVEMSGHEHTRKPVPASFTARPAHGNAMGHAAEAPPAHVEQTRSKKQSTAAQKEAPAEVAINAQKNLKYETISYLNRWPENVKRSPNWDKMYDDIKHRFVDVDDPDAKATYTWDVEFTYAWAGTHPVHHYFTSKADGLLFAAKYINGPYSIADHTLTSVKLVPLAAKSESPASGKPAARARVIYDDQAKPKDGYLGALDKLGAGVPKPGLRIEVNSLLRREFGDSPQDLALFRRIIKREGVRAQVYLDSKGILTVGIGQNIESGLENANLRDRDRAQAVEQQMKKFRAIGIELEHVLAGRPLDADEAFELLKDSVQVARRDAAEFIGKDAFKNLREHYPERAEVLVDMIFNMGLPTVNAPAPHGFQSFKKHLQAALAADPGSAEAETYFRLAAQDMVQSAWYGQVGGDSLKQSVNDPPRSVENTRIMGLDIDQQKVLRAPWLAEQARREAAKRKAAQPKP